MELIAKTFIVIFAVTFVAGFGYFFIRLLYETGKEAVNSENRETRKDNFILLLVILAAIVGTLILQ